ncbi:hypothetical protein ACFYMO_03795 [Streptomyces sp. NPDC007025]|uniref:hypothetical protein n=1 Tax=Streptomyces sp. NPDC007025 TaxID=3364771 RepID=UPI00369E6BAE
MTSEEREREAAALTELDKLTATYREAEESFDRARQALQAGIVKHLMERNAAPGKIAAHSPYDRNHIRRIGIQAGVPPLRSKTVRSTQASD